MDAADTIAAISSPLGGGLRGIVRLTGPSAWEIAGAVFEWERAGAGGGSDLECPVRRVDLGRVRVSGGRLLVPCFRIYWPGGSSYTGQPLIEFHLTGSVPVLQALLADLLGRGARLAEPGEFTLRAFLSGRLELTQAEAVLAVIEARTPAQLEASLRQLAGGLATPIGRLRNRLLDVLAHLEAGLDFVDESDVDPIARRELSAELIASGEELRRLSASLAGRDRPAETPRVVLVGPPNAGKSQLFNALGGGTRALVSDQAGTTRDYLVQRIDCGGIEVELVDTAGEDEARGSIEEQAQVHRTEQAQIADVLLACAAPGQRWYSPASGSPPVLRVMTKIDLGFDGSEERADVFTSARTGQGLVELREAIAEALRTAGAEGDPLAASTGARCRDALERTSACLASAGETLALGGGDELVSVDLRQAIDELGRVVGAVVTDDILDRIFRRFCIGK